MTKKDFKTISMNGRMAYQLMCAERYFTYKHPKLDFKELFKLLWQVTNGMWWDTFSAYIIELEPSFMLEKENYEDDEWLHLTKTQHDLFKPLISEFDEEDEEFMETLKDQAEVYAYTVVPKDTSESINIIFETIDFLKNNNIELPDFSLVQFSTIDQFNGWGDKFDGTKLSLILKD